MAVATRRTCLFTIFFTKGLEAKSFIHFTLAIKLRRIFPIPKRHSTRDDIRCSVFQTFTQNVDHFGFSNTDTFEQRYILNKDFWKSGSPIFFYAGNEGAIDLFCENTGFMWDIAPLFHAMIVFGEHRYYGTSLPYGNDSYSKPEYTRYLTSEQALADYVYLIEDIRRVIRGAEQSQVVVFGGSYGGMLAAYARMKYPHIFVASHAASAPILQFSTRCEAFAQIVTKDFLRESTSCVELVRASWAAINRLAQSSLQTLTDLFHFCKPLKNVDELKDWLIDMYGNFAMVDYPYETSFLSELPAYPIRVFCSNVTQTPMIKNDDVDIIQHIIKGVNVYFNYTGKTECFDIESQGDLGWSYQACTEMAMPMCSDGQNDMFEPIQWNFQNYSDDCYKQWQIRPRAEWTYIEYGGKNVTLLKSHSNIIFTNGNLDPWSSGGVLTPINNKLPSFIIDGGAHHLDLRSANVNDPASVVKVRQTIVALIEKYLSEK
ncbi:unnamed protein product [Didymodactylos carnosus]|uniref:Lysosomal Pro-X carboxypeptidase n=1 Tax=Didymodactylos carnosus TaxID=1234261 RepID=A0A8S2HRK7_9BILA|nr:unnamed protein product [Didymodactylos carnosus]CAF3678594.1 unnamed protein product [Didymodactylos carnosus]